MIFILLTKPNQTKPPMSQYHFFKEKVYIKIFKNLKGKIVVKL